MYDNNAYLEHVKKTEDYAKYREQMTEFRKWSNRAFWINLPIIFIMLTGIVLSIITLDILNMGFAYLIGAAATIFVTVKATYCKNKKAAYLMIGLYIFFAYIGTTMMMMGGDEGMASMPLVAFSAAGIVIYRKFIKALYNDDILKEIEGYPYFDEKTDMHNQLYVATEPAFGDMEYKADGNESIELPQNVESIDIHSENKENPDVFMEYVDASNENTLPEKEKAKLNNYMEEISF